MRRRPTDGGPASELEQRLARIQQQEHACLIYQDLAEAIPPTAQFLSRGLARKERCLYITGEHPPEQIADLLAAAGVDVAAERERGALDLRPGYAPQVSVLPFDPEALIALVRQLAEQAVAGGFAGLRVVADMTWTLSAGATQEQLARLEALGNELVAVAPITGICQYDEACFTRETIGSVLRIHPQVILDGRACLNPYYEPPAATDEPPNQSLPVTWKLLALRRLVLADAEHAQLTREQTTRAEAERVQRGLREMLRLYEHSVASAAHDLKNPLTAIRGYAQLVRRIVARASMPDSERVEDALAHIQANAATMTALLDELLDVAQLEADEPLRLERRPTDLVALIQRAVAQHQREGGPHPLRVAASVAKLTGAWDEARLERVVQNLLSNALKYSPEGGEVRVEVAREGDWAVLSVSDQGVGIPAADLPLIFERFHRARNVQGRAQGTGLGLWGARQIVEQHGGRIQIQSAEGQGTSVTVRLPLEPLPSIPPAPREAEKLTPRQRQIAVLIAQGYSNKQIAEELVLASGTVANHVENMLNRLGFHNRAQVAAWAVEQGLAVRARAHGEDDAP